MKGMAASSIMLKVQVAVWRVTNMPSKGPSCSHRYIGIITAQCSRPYSVNAVETIVDSCLLLGGVGGLDRHGRDDETDRVEAVGLATGGGGVGGH